MADELATVLSNLGLSSYLAIFKDEEINDVALLKSMGPEMLRESMAELEMQAAHVDKLAAALFGAPATQDDDEGLALEENDDDAVALEENDDDDSGLALEDNAVAVPATAMPPAAAAPTAPASVSDANRRAAERVKAQGNDALKLGKFKEASSLYGQAIGLDPTNAVYYSNRSSALGALGEYERALADAHKCVGLKPDWAKAHLRLAGAYSGLKRHEEAKRSFSSALACEPTNAQIKGLLEAASEACDAEADLRHDDFDWLQELNDRVAPTPFYEKGLELQDDSPMTIDYKAALQRALDEVMEEEGRCVLRTPSGAAFVAEEIAGTNFEKLVVIAKRRGGSNLKGAAKQVAVKLWHMKRDWRDEGDDDDGYAERMKRRAGSEHSRIRQLAGCKHWLQLVADVATETGAQLGGEQYPAIFLEHFPGDDLTELLTPMRRPGDKGARVGRKQASGGAEVDDDDHSDDDFDDDEDEDEEALAKARTEWEAAKMALTPSKLEQSLALVKTVALGVLRGMKEANEAGFRFENDGSEGPFLGDVLHHDGKIKLVDTEPLQEFDDEEDRRFTAEPLVYSPVGDFIRSWWVGVADMIDMKPGEMCPDARYQKVLDGYGTLNWLLFQWKPEQLHGDEIIHLLVHGPQAMASAAPDPTVEAHWEDFMQRAFVMLGPRRFDEVKEINELMQKGEIDGPGVVARSRYVFGRDFEGLHEEYLLLLKKMGFQLK